MNLAFSRLVSARVGRSPQVTGPPTEWDLWVADGDGGNARRLPVDGLAEGWAPWTPSLKRLLDPRQELHTPPPYPQAHREAE